MIRLDNNRFFDSDIIGEFHSVNEWIHPRRRIGNFELIFVIEGVVYITEDETQYELHKNDMLILEPHREHYGTKTVIGHTAFYWFHFNTDIPIPFKTATNNQEYDVKYLLKKLLHVANTPSYFKSASDSLGLLIFEELYQLSREKSESISITVNLIKEYIKNNINKNITVNEMSKFLGYNCDYIGKIFKKSTNTTLKSYIIEQRIKRAKDLLLTTSLNISEIASHLGYSEENLFVKFFIYNEGISPSQFRKKNYNTFINNK